MAEKNGGEQHGDLETGNTKAGSSSMKPEITTESASTPNEPPPTSVKKEHTTPNENSKLEGRTGEGMGTSKCIGCLMILLVVLGLLVLLLGPVCRLIGIVYFIVHEIAAPKKWTSWVVLQWIALVGFTGFLIASLTRHNLKNHLIWELELWKWCILLMLVVCGKLMSEWIVNAVFLLIRLLFADNLKVYCFAYGLKEKNQVFVWWGLFLIAWLVLVIWLGNGGGTRLEETKMIQDYVTRALASLFIGAGLWLGKDLLLCSFAFSFQSKNFFESVLKAKFCKFVIETLCGESVRGDLVTKYGACNWVEEINNGKKSAFSIKLFLDVLTDDSSYKLKPKLNKDQEKENDAEPPAPEIWEKVLKRTRKLEEEAARNSSLKIEDRLRNAGQGFLHRLPNLRRLRNAGQGFLHRLPNFRSNGKGGQEKKCNGKEKEAGPSQRLDVGSVEDSTAATNIISGLQRNSFYLLLKDQKKSSTDPQMENEVDMLFQLMGQTMQRENLVKGSDRRVNGKDFIKWIEIVYQEGDSLERCLQNTRRGIEELDKLASGIVFVLILIVWLLMMKVLSTQAVALILSQFFVLTFVFGGTCKRIFEGIVFVFVTHPFDIGDRYLIEDREEVVLVKEINIQTTVFSRFPMNHKNYKENIVYPNSVLATKHICNFKIPAHLSTPKKTPTPPKLDKTDSVEFVVDASTTIKQIEALSDRIRKFTYRSDSIKFRKSPWIKEISVRANGFEDGNKIRMGVYVTYNQLWKGNVQKSEWKSEIVLTLKQILEDMGISKYDPEENNVESTAAAIPPADV